MNTPNTLSLIRILIVPFMMFFFMADFLGVYGKIIAVVLFITAAITDLLDGKIARKTGQVTDLGKLLDPIADRLLYNVGMALIVVYGIVPSPYGIIGMIILLFRDFIIDGIRQIAASKGVVIQAVKSGKIKAILHYTHIPMFMLLAATRQFSGAFFDVFNQVLFIIALVVFALATIVTIWSACDYFLRSKSLILTDGNKQNNKKEEIINKEDEE